MSYAAIIPSKTFSNLAECVAAILKHEDAPKVIVVDDGLDATEMKWWSPGPPYGALSIERVPGEKPFVFSRNINIGVRAAMEKWPDVTGFVLCNDDALLESPGGFSLLAKECDEHPEYGLIGATTNLTGQPLQRRRNVGLREVPHIAFVCVYIPLRTFETVQWMDERYCLDYGCDDRDMCEAVTRAGLKVGVHDGCYVDHGSLVSSFRGDPRAARSFAQNYALLLEKWGSIA